MTNLLPYIEWIPIAGFRLPYGQGMFNIRKVSAKPLNLQETLKSVEQEKRKIFYEKFGIYVCYQ